MMKLVLALILLVITLPLISESFSYFDADMINYDLENTNYNLKESKSEIIQFNESSNEHIVAIESYTFGLAPRITGFCFLSSHGRIFKMENKNTQVLGESITLVFKCTEVGGKILRASVPTYAPHTHLGGRGGGLTDVYTLIVLSFLANKALDRSAVLFSR